MSITTLILAGMALGLFYANSTYVSMLLRNRLDDGGLKPADALPAEVVKTTAEANRQYAAGIVGMATAAGFFIAFLWT